VSKQASLEEDSFAVPLNKRDAVAIDTPFDSQHDAAPEGGFQDPQLGAFNAAESLAPSDASELDLAPPPEWYISLSDAYEGLCIYQAMHWVVMTSVFNNLMLAGIMLNTVSLSLDRYPISIEESDRLELINSTCTWFFLGEMITKLVGLGLVTYASDTMNQFDALVVIVSMVELGLAAGDEEGESSNRTLTLFRGFRLLRVFRLFRRWHSFHRMLLKIADTFKDILTFTVLLLIIVLVFSLLGVELFNNYMKFDSSGDVDLEGGKTPRLNFDDPANGIISVFVCMIGDDWQGIMHNIVRTK
jgi:hypothetical protein